MADLLRQLATEKRLLDSLSEYVILIGVVQKDTFEERVLDIIDKWDPVVDGGYFGGPPPLMILTGGTFTGQTPTSIFDGGTF